MAETASAGAASVRDMRRVDGGVDLDILLPPDHPCFRGHFPGVPILPGAVQIDWAVRLADEHLGTGIGAACRFQVKFRRVIRPGRTVMLALRLVPEKQALTFAYRGGDALYSTGRIQLREAR